MSRKLLNELDRLAAKTSGRKWKRPWGTFGDGSNYAMEGWSVAHLRDFWSDFKRAGRAHVDRLWPRGDAPKGAAKALQTLANYAMNASLGQELRLQGDITRATTYEQHAELSYGRLPDWMRW